MSAFGTVKEMSVVPVLRGVLHDHVDVDVRRRPAARTARPRCRAGRARRATVTLASLTRRVTTPEMIGSSMLGSSSVTQVPGSQVKLERTWSGDVVVAGELDRAQGEHLAAGAGHLEHLVEADAGSLRACGHDARVGGEHAGDVGVDLAGVGAERLRRAPTAVVSEPPRPSVVISLLGGHALEAGDDGDLARRRAPSRTRSPLHLEDLGLAVDGVGDDADLAAGEADGVDAEVGERHAQQRHGLALAGGEQHVHLAARLGASTRRWRGR